MNDIVAIRNYILFLKRECNLSVSIHSCCSNLILKTELLPFHIHENPYCIYVKSCAAAQAHCIKKQEKVAKKCENGSFCGSCWAGVQEFVYPVLYKKNVVGFICVSGFANPSSLKYLLRTSKKYDLELTRLQESYASLKTKIPDKSYVDVLIYPLCDMLELAHIKAEERTKSNDKSLVWQMNYYIKRNYTKNLTSEILCKEFHCSRSHCSKIFNAQMKKSLPEYVTELRIEAAKDLLRYSELDIGDVALSVGFNQSYYFTAVFKKSVGLTPSAYKKRFLEQKEK